MKALKGAGVGSGESASVHAGMPAAGVEGSSHMVPTLSREKAFLGVGAGAATAAAGCSRWDGRGERDAPLVTLLETVAGVEGGGNAKEGPPEPVAC